MASNDNARLPAQKSDDDVIEPEVMDPVSDGAKPSSSAASPPAAPIGFILNPLSGVLILVLDYAFFGGDLVTGGLGYPLTCLMAFVLSGIGVFLVQHLLADEPRGKALVKAFISGVITGAPTPISGTIFATLILGVSGLNLLSRLLPQRNAKAPTRQD